VAGGELIHQSGAGEGDLPLSLNRVDMIANLRFCHGWEVAAQTTASFLSVFFFFFFSWQFCSYPLLHPASLSTTSPVNVSDRLPDEQQLPVRSGAGGASQRSAGHCFRVREAPWPRLSAGKREGMREEGGREGAFQGIVR